MAVFERIRVCGLQHPRQHTIGVSDLHGVRRVGQAGEGVLTRGIGHRAGDNLVAAAFQHHGYASNAGFARVLYAIRVQIYKHKFADGMAAVDFRCIRVAVGIEVVTKIRIQKHIARIEYQRRAGFAVFDAVGITAGFGVETGGQAGFIHLHHIAVCGQIIENVTAIRDGHCGTRRIVARAAVFAVAVVIGEQVHAHTRQARFIVILYAVVIGVNPHPVANRAQRGGGRRVGDCWRGVVVAEIRCAVFLLRQQSDRGHAIWRAGAAVFVIGAIDQASGQGGFLHTNGINAWPHVVDDVVAVVVSGRKRFACVQHVVVVAIQEHGDARNARFACVLLAIAIFIQPHAVANRARQFKAEIVGVIVLALAHCCQFSRRVIGLVIGFGAVRSRGVGGFECAASGGHELRLAVGRRSLARRGAGEIILIQQQVIKAILARAVGLGGGGDLLTIGVSNGQGHVAVG